MGEHKSSFKFHLNKFNDISGENIQSWVCFFCYVLLLLLTVLWLRERRCEAFQEVCLNIPPKDDRSGRNHEPHSAIRTRKNNNIHMDFKVQLKWHFQ